MDRNELALKMEPCCPKAAAEVRNGIYHPAWDAGRKVRLELKKAGHDLDSVESYVRALLVMVCNK